MEDSQAVTLFISYAHADEDLKLQLEKHLTPLKRNGLIDKWSDHQIEPGQDWANQIDRNLKTADIILLLVSPDFVSSDYCTGIELKEAMKRCKNGEAIVVPVILKPCNWMWLEFKDLQAVPKEGKAITTWPDKDLAFLDVTTRIGQLAQGLLDQRKKQRDDKQVAAARYKSKVEEVLSDGDITPLERKTLNELRDLLGLTAEEAEAIKDSAYQPLRQYQSKLGQYRIDLVETIAHEYPLSERTKVDLKQRQRELGLKAEDAEHLEVELLAEAEATYQAQLKTGEAAAQCARAEAAQRAREAAERQAREDADLRDREADELQRRAAAQAQAQRERELASQREAAEEAQRLAAHEQVRQAAEREARLQAEEAGRIAAAEAARLAEVPARRPADADALPVADQRHRPVGLAPTPPAAMAQAAVSMAAAAATLPLQSAQPAPSLAAASAVEAPLGAQITPRKRLLAAGVGAVVFGVLLLMFWQAMLGYGNISSALLAATFGAIAGAISASYRWIAVAGVLIGMIGLTSPYWILGSPLWAVIVIGGAIVIEIRRRLSARK